MRNVFLVTKTELFAIGLQKVVQEEFYHKTCTSIKILGIYFDYHNPKRKHSNFNSILQSIEKSQPSQDIACLTTLLHWMLWYRDRVWVQETQRHACISPKTFVVILLSLIP